MKKRTLILFVTFAVLMIIVVGIIINNKTLFLSDGEKGALRLADEIQSELVFPESLNVISVEERAVSDNFCLNNSSSLNGYKTWIMMYYSAKNSDGNIYENQAIAKIELDGDLEIIFKKQEQKIESTMDQNETDIESNYDEFEWNKMLFEYDTIVLDETKINNLLK
jgi:hypothetical protein